MAWSQEHSLGALTDSLQQLRSALRWAASDSINASWSGLLGALADLVDERGTAAWATIAEVAADDRNHGSLRLPNPGADGESGPPATTPGPLHRMPTAAAVAAAAAAAAAVTAQSGCSSRHLQNGGGYNRRSRSLEKLDDPHSPSKPGARDRRHSFNQVRRHLISPHLRSDLSATVSVLPGRTPS